MVGWGVHEQIMRGPDIYRGCMYLVENDIYLGKLISCIGK